jgi:hypothetical protein
MPPQSGYQLDIKRTWLDAIQAGIDFKLREYTAEAEQCETFYGKDQKNLYSAEFTADVGIVPSGLQGMTSGGVDGNIPRTPIFNVRDNAAAQAVQILVPMFLHGEMVASVKPNKPFTPPPQLFGVQGDPNQPQPIPPPNNPQAIQQYIQQEMARQQFFMATQQSEMEFADRTYRSGIIEATINYILKECNLKEEARPALRDMIVRGMGLLHTEMVDMPNGTGRLAGASYMDDDRIVIDPDAKRIRDAKWVAILCEHDVWEVAKQYQAYGVKEEDLNASNVSTVGDRLTRHQYDSSPRKNNVFRYWKVFSRCGIGARLKPKSERSEIFSMIDESLGDYCYIVVAEGCDFPLNLTPEIEQMAMQTGGIQPYQVVTSWPCPFFYDNDDPWPFTAGWFHERKGSPWPKSHLSFSLGYLNFMAWILGFLAEGAYRNSRGAWIMDETVSEKVVEWLKNGQTDEIIKITRGVGGEPIKSLIEYFEGPKFNGDLIGLYEFMNKQYQDMSGLTDLLQGQMDRQIRSAEEASVLQSASQLRPQDMAAKVTAWLSRVVRKIAILLRYSQSGQDLAVILGQFGAQAWDTGIRTQNMAELFREANYSVETGKGRVPDVNAELENINQAMQFFFPPLMQAYMSNGDPSAVNGIIEAWGKVRQMNEVDIDKFMMKPFIPPPPPGTPVHEAQTRHVKEQMDKEKEQQKSKGGKL